MPATAEEIEASNELCALKDRLRAMWMTGDYDLFSRYMEKDSEPFFRRLGIVPGTRLLDVACGSGQLALIAARAGALATGCDIAANWLVRARQRAAAEGLKIDFNEADAESLPYTDGQFHSVVSIFGAMFAPRPDLVAAELVRVCRPGGIIAMANWTPGGFIGQMFKAISRHIAPAGMPSPVLWGDEEVVPYRLSKGIANLRLTPRIFHFEYPFSPESVVEFFQTNYGPMSRAFSSLNRKTQENLRKDLVSLWRAHNRAAHNATLVEAEYLEVVATRSAA